MARYRKMPVVIEAVQMNWSTWDEVCEFLGDIVSQNNPARYTADTEDTFELTIPTLEGNMTANFNDFIIKGVNGEFYPCKPDIFEKTYELVEE